MEDWSCVLQQWVEVELGARVAVGLLQHWEGEVAEVGGEDGLAPVGQHHPQAGQLGKGEEEIWLPKRPLLKSTKKLLSLAKASLDVRVEH